jgi:DNA-directed RNA polymerase specialized sigma24 family protein
MMNESAEPSSPQDVVPTEFLCMPPTFCLEVSPEDSDPRMIDETLERYEPYIRTQVKQKALSYPKMAEQNLDDIAQNVRIRFWQRLCVEKIEHPKAYLQRMIDHAFIDFARSQKRGGQAILLSVPSSSEQKEEAIPDICDMTMPDPETDVVQREAACTRAIQSARAIEHLPPRQKLAMECSLCERLDDPAQFGPLFRACHVNVENAQWPAAEQDKRRLKASLSAARRTIAHTMDFDLSDYKRKGASRAS